MQLATAVADVAVISSPRNSPGHGLRLQEEPAEHLGLPDGVAVRADDSSLDGRAAAEHDVDLLSFAARLEVAGDEGVGVPARPARLALRIIRWPISWST